MKKIDLNSVIFVTGAAVIVSIIIYALWTL